MSSRRVASGTAPGPSWKTPSLCEQLASIALVGSVARGEDDDDSDYDFKVDDNAVWRTISEDVPKLAALLAETVGLAP